MGYGTTPDNTIINDKDDDLTRPSPSPGQLYVTQGDVHDDNDLWRGDGSMSTASSQSENNEAAAAIVDASYRQSRVTWKSANGQAQQIFDVSLDLYVNTSTNTAIFKLYSYIIRKGNKGKSNKQAVYLFIHPEKIQAITCETSRTTRRSKSKSRKPSHYTLHFSLTERPHLVVPKSHALESRDKTKAQLDLIQDLAGMTDFVVHLNSSNTTISKPDDLKLLESIFSPTATEHRPCTDDKRANLATLYAGNGGEIVTVNRVVAAPVETDPPPYTGPAPDFVHVSNDFQHPDYSEEEEDDDDDDDDCSFTTHVLFLLQDLQSHFNNIERYFDGMERRLDGLERCVQQRKHEISYALAAGHHPYRYNADYNPI
ncbi:hypothetical protein ACHAQJ_002516 [Trichoderma viride]